MDDQGNVIYDDDGNPVELDLLYIRKASNYNEELDESSNNLVMGP